ncbi:MAG TPA: metalloregulator ArsR/SmtB family transcription factor [Polyangiaceae bacterium LLY-WYZ-14_1]|nr:metalloregulator ArsR/SmtB family transcription factor [Polyangiaceae bacterium LLY-WYZ-14_1]
MRPAAHPTLAERDAFFAGMAGLSKALGHPVRVRIVSMLSQGPRSVDAIAGRTGQSMSTTSAHLHKLAAAGVLRAARRDKRVFYRVADDEALGLWLQLQRLALRTRADLREVAGAIQREPIESRPVDELLAAARAGELRLLDLRPPDEYRAGHLPGARNLPLGELEARLDEVPREVPVVLYCRGLHCVALGRGQRLLLERGYDARRCVGSVMDWRHAGLDLATGEE